jgi:hypothetical protein
VTFSVLNSKLPAQFFSFSPAAQLRSGDKIGVAATAEDIFRNVRLFIVLKRGVNGAE